MTSVVSISAHCGDAKEVRVVVTDAGSLVEEFHIANGEKAERYAYDDRVISVKEVAKIDRRAKEIEDAEFSLRQANLRFQDAASRGFPESTSRVLEAEVAAKQAALDALTAEVTLVPSHIADVEIPVPLTSEAKACLDSLDPAPFSEPAGPGRQVPWHRSGGGVAPLNPTDRAVYGAIAMNYAKDDDSVEGPTES